MKKFVSALAVMAVFMLVLVLGAAAVCKSSVEDITRSAVLSLAGPGESSVDTVEFSPITREITLSGWSSRQTPGPATYSASGISARATVTLRGMLTCLPMLGNLVFDADSIVPLLTDVEVRGLAWSGPVQTGAIDRLSAGTVSLPYSLALQYAGGLRPPFAVTVTGVSADRLDMRGVHMEMDEPAGGRLTLQAEGVRFKDLVGSSASLVNVSGLRLTDAAGTAACADLVLNDLHITPALLSELMARHPRGGGFIPESLARGLEANGPVISRAFGTGISGENDGFAWTAGSWELRLLGQGPDLIDTRLTRATLPASLLTRKNSPLSLDMSGMERILLDFEGSLSGTDDMRVKGSVRADGLADLSLDMTVLRGDAVRNLVAAWTDHGAMARLARSVAREPHAAGMAMKAGVMQLCGDDAEADKAVCERICDFVDAPGSLTVRAKPGRDIRYLDFFHALRRFGSLFDAECAPSHNSLTAQSEALFPPAAEVRP